MSIFSFIESSYFFSIFLTLNSLYRLHEVDVLQLVKRISFFLISLIAENLRDEIYFTSLTPLIHMAVARRLKQDVCENKICL